MSSRNGHKITWCNIQEIVEIISTLHAGAKVKKDKGKPIVCSVLGAVVLAAVEHDEHQQKADMEIIASLQDLVKVSQLQLEEVRLTPVSSRRR